MADPENDMPLFIVEVDPDVAMAANTTPDGDPDPTTPFGAALLWWQGLADPVEYRHALEHMSVNPGAWGDYSHAAETLNDMSILTGVEDNPDRDDVKYIRFIPFGGDGAGQVFETGTMTEFMVVTLIKPPGDSWWRVWGLSDGYFPGTDEIFK